MTARRKTIQELSTEENVDPFRLAILGFRSIELHIGEALAGAFGGALPNELRRTHFNVRVSLAVALGLMPADLKRPLGRLKKIRDEFAHGDRTDLGPSDGREMFTAMCEIAPDVKTELAGLRGEYPPIVLAGFLLLLQEALSQSFDDAGLRREEQEKALAESWHRRRNVLTLEEIEALLAEDEST
jgi:hypothetical protein